MAWRAAFSGFGAKPSRYPSSAEALVGRVLKGQPLPRVNVLVDLYNAVSVRHVVPLGGEDADRLEGALHLTVADGSETFDDELVAPGEVVWRDDRGVTCRRWNWRQGRRTRLTEDTTNAFFVFLRVQFMRALPMELQDAAKIAAVADWIGEVLDDLVGQIDQNIVVETSIDPKLQSVAEASIIDELAAKSVKFNVSQGALVAMRRPQNNAEVYVGWRLLGTDPAGVAFNLYRSTAGGT